MIDPRQFRNALGSYASGITVISGVADQTPYGFTCQSFFSLSLDPPLVCFSVQKTTSTWPKIRPLDRFSINILAQDQQELSQRFAGPADQRWLKTQWSPSAAGTPFLTGALLQLECSLHTEHEAGDHLLIIANVHQMAENAQIAETGPLVFYRGRYQNQAA